MSENTLGIKVELNEHFSVIRESLDRIGMANKSKRTLMPICYILHKNNRDTNESEYFVIHLKNLKRLDGEDVYYTDEDDIKQSSIAKLLQSWGLIKIVDETVLKKENAFVYVLPYKDKKDWTITHKYKIGNTL